MKGIAVPILLLLMATQAFGKWLVLLEYKLNQTYYAQVLCENKAKPQLKCKGKCAAMKKMAAEESQSSPSEKNNSSKPGFAEELIVLEEAFRLPSSPGKANTAFGTKEKSWTPLSSLCSVFHPPLV